MGHELAQPGDGLLDPALELGSQGMGPLQEELTGQLQVHLGVVVPLHLVSPDVVDLDTDLPGQLPDPGS